MTANYITNCTRCGGSHWEGDICIDKRGIDDVPRGGPLKLKRQAISRNSIKSIRKLEAGGRYAVVFNHRITQEELENLREICQAAGVQILILTDARVVPMEKIGTVAARVAKEEYPDLDFSLLDAKDRATMKAITNG